MKENNKDVIQIKREGALLSGLKSKVTFSTSIAPGAVFSDNTVSVFHAINTFFLTGMRSGANLKNGQPSLALSKSTK